MPETIKDIFLQMKYPSCVDKEIRFESTYEEFVEFVKGSSEKTSTSPSGHGYNHYKTMLIEGDDEQLRVWSHVQKPVAFACTER